jgi:hypothetical protein
LLMGDLGLLEGPGSFFSLTCNHNTLMSACVGQKCLADGETSRICISYLAILSLLDILYWTEGLDCGYVKVIAVPWLRPPKIDDPD